MTSLSHYQTAKYRLTKWSEDRRTGPPTFSCLLHQLCTNRKSQQQFEIFSNFPHPCSGWEDAMMVPPVIITT